MIAIISPSKTMDFTPSEVEAYTIPFFLEPMWELVTLLKTYEPIDLKGIMKMSDKLSMETKSKFAHFQKDHTPENSKQAVLSYTGDVFQGLCPSEWSESDFSSAQQQLVILSGLYGALRPLDLIQPYRLELGAKLSWQGYKNLYEYWSLTVTDYLNNLLSASKDDVLINLASDEYFKIIDKKSFKGKVLSIGFKEFKNGQLKFISFHAKKARGLFARYLVQNDIMSTEELMHFQSEGYEYYEEDSTDDHLVFVR